MITRVTLTTASTPGAVAIVQLQGSDVAAVLQQLTGRSSWPARRAYLANFADIDEGLAIKLDGEAAQLMPHGGPRVVQRLLEHLNQNLGCTYVATPDTQTLYPEADSPIEADMLDAIARAASPVAIDLLAQQPKLWRTLIAEGGIDVQKRLAIETRSVVIESLITPPSVVVFGPANAGKSTLTNALMGKSVSIVSDLPGTTRDWVGGLVELSVRDQAADAVAVNWLDTPGLRESDDAIEQRAISLAAKQIEQADLLIAMRDPDQPWPDDSSDAVWPGLWVVNKVDDAPNEQSEHAGCEPDSPLLISAAKERGLDLLQLAVTNRLGLGVYRDSCNKPMAFSTVLQRWCAAPDEVEIKEYLGV